MKKLNKIVIFLTFLIPSIAILIYSGDVVNAETNTWKDKKNTVYESHLTEDEISNIFNLKVEDIADPWDWLSDTQTYIIHQTDEDGSSNYWWNAPNIQSSVFNSFYDNVTDNGYGNGIGVEPKENNKIVNIGKKSDAKNAMQKYGFHIPTPTYLGERPLVTISVTDVIKPDSPLNAVGRFFEGVGDWIKGKGFTIVKAPTANDLNSLIYVSPRDYENGNSTFENYVKKNWSTLLEKMPEGQILDGEADEETGKSSDGNFYVWGAILEAEPKLRTSKSEKKICQYLKNVCGSKYGDVAQNIVLAGEKQCGIKENNITTRMMPFDYDALNSIDKDLVKIKDPRCEMQYNLVKTGWLNKASNISKSIILKISGSIAELTVALNGFSNFTFVENAGIEPTTLWDNAILGVVVSVAFIIFFYYTVKSAFAILGDRDSKLRIVIKTFTTFILVAVIVAISIDTSSSYKLIKDTSNKVFNLFNTTLSKDESLGKLYGSSTGATAENVSIWLPYFNLWSTYQTNHSITDDSQKMSFNNPLKPETMGLNNVVPKIDGIDQNLYSTILAEAFTKNENYSNSIYRVVDHFMAPRVNDYNTNLENIKITKNENYNGNIQSTINISTIPFQIAIFILVLLKVIVFFEFIFDIAMLLINICLSIVEKNKLKRILKELGAAALSVAMLNMILTLVIYSCLITEGLAGIILAVVFIFIIVKTIKYLSSSDSVFAPHFFKMERNIKNKISKAFTD